MLCYTRIDALEGFEVNKSNKSKECIICHYWYFLNKGDMNQKYATVVLMY